jgi:hypothetical protein
MNGIFYLVGLIVVAIIVVYSLGHWWESVRRRAAIRPWFAPLFRGPSGNAAAVSCRRRRLKRSTWHRDIDDAVAFKAMFDAHGFGPSVSGSRDHPGGWSSSHQSQRWQ